jgi:hypothetical protein
MPKINWISFGLGVLFALFVLPMVMGFITSRRKTAA